MADADDYESLPDGAPFKFVALAGAAAGIAEHCIMYPIDSVKVSRDWKKICITYRWVIACQKFMEHTWIDWEGAYLFKTYTVMKYYADFYLFECFMIFMYLRKTGFSGVRNVWHFTFHFRIQFYVLFLIYWIFLLKAQNVTILENVWIYPEFT